MSRRTNTDDSAISKSNSSVAASPSPGRRTLPAPNSHRKASTQVKDNPLMLQSGGSLGYKRAPMGLSLGYVGPSGYSAILDEAKGHLGTSIWDDTDAVEPWKTHPHGTSPGRQFCRKILAWIPSRDVSKRALCRDVLDENYYSYHMPSMRRWHEAFWATYGEALQEPRTDDKLNDMIDEIVKNTTIPIPIDPATNSAWLESYCGHKTRWEMIGELLLIYGTVALSQPETEPLLAELLPPHLKSNKKSFAYSMLECADACILLCDELDISSNVLIVGLLARAVTVLSVVAGDAGFELWKRCGLLANAVTGLGLHRKLENMEEVAPLYVDVRSRVYNNAYQLDKSIATFVGRPAALSRRYMSIPLPLDVPDDALENAGSMRELLELVGPQGWNSKGALYLSTRRRAYMLSNIMRDEILELSLTQLPGENVTARVCDVRIRLEELGKQLPPIFSITLDKRAFSERQVGELAAVVGIRVHLLHSTFLVERIEHEGKDEQRLLNVAKEMLNIVVLYWSERDRFPAANRDAVHWYIASVGIPSASALAIDLFKQTTSPWLKSPSSQRPEIIQDLSLFIACLDWIRPEDGNYVLCGRVRKMIKHILDGVLSANFSASSTKVPEHDWSSYNLDDISVDNVPQFGVQYGNWLDEIDAAGLGADWTNGMLQY